MKVHSLTEVTDELVGASVRAFVIDYRDDDGNYYNTDLTAIMTTGVSLVYYDMNKERLCL